MTKTDRVLECVQRLQNITEGIQGSARAELDRELATLRAIVQDAPSHSGGPEGGSESHQRRPRVAAGHSGAAPRAQKGARR